MRLGSDGWRILALLPSSELDRITELERQAGLTDEALAASVKGLLNERT